MKTTEYKYPIKLVNAVFYPCPDKEVIGYVHRSANLDNNGKYYIKLRKTNLPDGVYEIKIEADTLYEYFVIKVRNNKFKVIWSEDKIKKQKQRE